MATKQLFQILLRNRDGIKQGITKVQDIVTEYLSTTGAKAISPDERFTINKEFSELAPSNVVGDIFGDFQGLQKDAGDVITDTPFTDKVRQQNPGVELRGDETFGELTEKLGKPKDQGLGSLFPKGETDSIFNQKNSNRAEVAAFMKAMREAGIKNEDVMSVVKDKTNFKRQPAYEFDSNRPKEVVDLAEGKRAATTLARAADMNADTAIKQELLGTLDEDIATNGPKFFQEEFMGYDSMGNLLENITTTVNNGIYDDLIEQGVPEDKVSEIFRYIASVRDNMKYDPKALLRKIADDVEMEDIKYDTTFWDNYIDEILTRIQKPEPRFADGGLV